MRKASTLLIIGILIMSSLSAIGLAEEDAQPQLRDGTKLTDDQRMELKDRLETQVQVQLDDLSDEELQKLRLVNAERIKDLDAEALKERLMAYRVEQYDPVLGFKERVIAQERKLVLTREQEALDEAEDGLEDDVEETKRAFENAKAAYKACEGDDSPDCESVRTDAIQKAKDHLLKHADLQKTVLDKFKNRVEGSEVIDGDRAEAILDEIEDKKADLEVLKESVQAAETKEELKDIAEELYGNWKQWREMLRVREVQMSYAITAGVLQQAEQLELKLERILAKLADLDVDTTGLEEQIDTFHAEVAAARADYEASQEKLKQAFEERAADEPDVGLIKTLNDEAHILLESAKSHLDTARDVFEDIWETYEDEREELEFDEDDEILEEEDELEEYELDDQEDAQEEIGDAAEEIAEAEEKLIEAEAEGKETTLARERLQEANQFLEQARTAYQNGNYDEAEDLAEDAKRYAAQARMTYLGKTAEDFEDDDSDDDAEDDSEDDDDLEDDSDDDETES